MSKKKPVSFSMDAETHDRFVGIAQELDTNKSVLVTNLITKFCEQHEDQDNYYVLLTIPKEQTESVSQLRSWLSSRMGYLLGKLSS